MEPDEIVVRALKQRQELADKVARKKLLTSESFVYVSAANYYMNIKRSMLQQVMIRCIWMHYYSG